MLRKLRTYAPLAVFAALLVAIGYWNIRPESFLDHRAAPNASGNDIDFYVLNAHGVQYKADGSLQYRMTVDKIEHVGATDITLLTQPDMLLYREGDVQPWHIRSDRGEVAPKGTQAELIDSVLVERTDARNRPTTLTTSRLTLFPRQEYAQTDQAVRIDAANGVTTAKGMKAYLNDGRLLLLSNVRGQHAVR